MVLIPMMMTVLLPDHSDLWYSSFLFIFYFYFFFSSEIFDDVLYDIFLLLILFFVIYIYIYIIIHHRPTHHEGSHFSNSAKWPREPADIPITCVLRGRKVHTVFSVPFANTQFSHRSMFGFQLFFSLLLSIFASCQDWSLYPSCLSNRRWCW